MTGPFTWGRQWRANLSLARGVDVFRESATRCAYRAHTAEKGGQHGIEAAALARHVSESVCVCARLHAVSLQREPHLVFPRHILHPEPHGALAIFHGGTRVQHLHQILPLHLSNMQAMGDPDA
jgi:hypothetical protein